MHVYDPHERSVKWNFSDSWDRTQFFQRVEIELRRLNTQWSGDCIFRGCSKSEHESCISVAYDEVNRIILKCGEAQFGCREPA